MESYMFKYSFTYYIYIAVKGMHLGARFLVGWWSVLVEGDWSSVWAFVVWCQLV